MQVSEKFCLTWIDFNDNVNSTFKYLREESKFSDVTLACEDGQQIEAHKFILATSSPFFRNILKRNKHPNTLIYMRGIKFTDLSAILDYLYYGEANIYQENLNSFLAIAEELGLKGISREVKNIKEETYVNNFEVPPDTVKHKTAGQNDSNKHNNSATEPTLTISEYDQMIVKLDQQINSMMVASDRASVNVSTNKAYTCQLCGKEGSRQTVKEHIESKHIDGFSHPCKVCSKSFRTRDNLKHHKYAHFRIGKLNKEV